MKRSRSLRQATLTSSASVKKPKTCSFGKWTHVDSCLVFRHNDQINDSAKIASFDFDSTLAATKSGKTFPQYALDWEYWHSSVEDKMEQLKEEKYKLVIFTNQNGIGKGKITEQFFKERMEHFIETLGVPIDVYAATHQDHYRKPNIGMWELMHQHTSAPQIDMKQSFFCGDAAGRAKGWKKSAKKDFSCSDRKFALNVGVTFHTPDEFFLGEPVHDQYQFYSLTPDELRARFRDRQPLNPGDYVTSEQELVVFVAFPASGKSTFAKKYMVPHGYLHVNQDTLGTKAKCIKATREALAEGKSVVVDNTNPDPATRATYINLAKKLNIPVRCFYFHDVDLELSHHLNMYRENMTQGKRKHIPKVAYNVFKKKFKKPTEAEGFSSVLNIDFVPTFEDKKSEEKFYQHVHKM